MLLVGIGVGLGVALAGNSSASPSAKLPARGSLANHATLPNAAEVQRLFAGIPQHGNVLGSASAPVTMAEYIDLQCPYCDQFELQVLPDLLTRYVRSGKVKIEARPLAFIGPDSKRGRAAAIAAGRQNKMFNYMELLYANQKTENTGWLNDTIVGRAAAIIPNLSVAQLLDDRNSSATNDAAARFDALAKADKVKGTPTILVGKSKGTLREVALNSPTDETAVATAINSALASR